MHPIWHNAYLTTSQHFTSEETWPRHYSRSAMLWLLNIQLHAPNAIFWKVKEHFPIKEYNNSFSIYNYIVRNIYMYKNVL
jgi:hypothetical protein